MNMRFYLLSTYTYYIQVQVYIILILYNITPCSTRWPPAAAVHYNITCAYTYLHGLTSIKIEYNILFAAIKTLEFVLCIAKLTKKKKNHIPIDIERMQSCNDF